MVQNKKQITSSPLRLERERRGWSRQYVAESLEVDVVTVGRWERGERLPQPYHRQKLCELFEKNAQELGLLLETPEEADEQKDIAEPSLRASDSPLQPSTSDEKRKSIYAPLQRRRRVILIGLASVGAAVLAGGSIWGATRITTSPAPSAPTPIMPRKPLYQLFDANSNNWINNVAYSPDGNMLAVASGGSVSAVWNIQKRTIVGYYPTLNQWVNDISWSRNNLLVTANGGYDGGSLQVHRFSETQPIFTLTRDHAVRTVSWSPQGEYLAFGGRPTTIEVWDPIANRQMSSYSYADQDALGINRVKWSFDARYLASAGDDGTVHVWEAMTGKTVMVYSGHRDRVIDIAWCPGKYLIASASADQTVRVWDALSGRTHVTYTGHTGEVHGIDWSPDKKHLVSGSYDTTVQIWEALTGQHVASYTGRTVKVLTVSWSASSALIALGTQGQGCEVWQTPNNT